MAVFRVFTGRSLVGEYFFDDGPLIIGRHHDADIYVKQDVVSRKHAVVKKTGKTWTIENVGGKNGLFVNGAYTGFKVLANGDRIELGRSIIQFEESAEQREAQARRDRNEAGSAYFRSMDEVMSLLNETEDDDIASIRTSRSDPPRPAPPPDDDDDDDEDMATVMLTVGQMETIHTANEADQTNHLSWFDDQNKHQYLALTGTPIVFGRGSEVQVPIKGGIGIGNRFALVTQEGGDVYVERCSRLASVKVNGIAVKAPIPLQDGDKIRIYDSLIIFHTSLFD